jgi:hypothetical protein
MSLRKKISWHSQGALKDMHVMFFSQNGVVHDHPVPIFVALWQDKVKPAVCPKQPELLEHGVISLQENATPHCHNDVQNLVQHWGWEVLAHPCCCPHLAMCDYWLFEHVKAHIQGKQSESEDDINTAVTVS